MSTKPSKPNAHILEEATSWFIDLHETQANSATRGRFNTWLRTSPEHVRAYLQVTAFWEDTRVMPKPQSIESLVHRARAARQNVIPLGGMVNTELSHRESNSRLTAMSYAATLLIVLGAAVLAWHHAVSGVYKTEIGEQRSIPLEDGSTVQLNSRTHLRVHFTEHERTIELIEGQALFRVTKNAQRPFIVHASGATIRAVGTAFDVYEKRTGTVVTVVEGKVGVIGGTSPSSADPGSVSVQPAEILLAAGQRLAVGSKSDSQPQAANVASATAWTEKKMIFDETPLDQVVQEFNRYNRQQLVIRDPELDVFHISGTFPSTDSDRIIEILRRRFGVLVTRHEDEIDITRGP